MHMHEKLGSEDVSPPSLRITAGELTHALASLEVRRQEALRLQEEEAQYLARTIPVEEAVRELNLDFTPSEVSAEVLAHREALKREAQTLLAPLKTRRPEAVISHGSGPLATDQVSARACARESKIMPVLFGILLLKSLFIWILVRLCHG